MTKKILAIILSVLMCAACGVTVFAEDEASDSMDIESILSSEIVQEIMASEGVTDITNIVLDVVMNAGSIDIQAMGTEKATQFIQNIINGVGEQLQDTVTNYEAFGTDPIAIVDRLFDLDVKDTIQGDDSDEDENTDTDMVIGMGDVDGDGKILAADARLILRRAAKLIEFTDEQDYLADVDDNGKVTANDARIVLRVAANLETLDY